jgi:hypothetical protein
VTTVAIVVNIDPEGLVPYQPLGAVDDLGIVIEAQFVFEGGEEALLKCVVQAAALGRHAAGDLALFQQLPVRRCTVMTPLVRINQELKRFNLAVPQSPDESFKHQRGLHDDAHGTADSALCTGQSRPPGIANRMWC